MREQEITTRSSVHMNWKRELHLSFKSAALTIGLHLDTCGCIAGEVLRRMGN